MKLVVAMLKAIHAQEDRKAAEGKAEAVIQRHNEMKLFQAAKKVRWGNPYPHDVSERALEEDQE